MDIKQHLICFSLKAVNDSRVSPTHVAVYLAILIEYLVKEKGLEMNVNRDRLMARAKISSRTTYNKCMNDLSDFGFIRYKPSFDSYYGSVVYLNPL